MSKSSTASVSTDNKIWHISQIDLFKSMTQLDIERMGEISHMDKIPRWSPIYLPGAPATSIYFLKQGRVRISRLSEDGKQITLSILEAGSIFGELSILDGNAPHDNIAEAVEDTLLCQVQREDFENYLKHHPELSLRVTKWMGLRLRQIENKVEELVFKSASERLKSLLLRLSLDYPKRVLDGVLIHLPLTHQDLGELTNIARPTVTEQLKKLEQEGFLRFEKRRIVVLDP
jgi:CRP/FNR family transcriptional regulator, cyclic AMP receptor protein